jgi:uncharacterized protein YgiM (DUF1202 family)
MQQLKYVILSLTFVLCLVTGLAVVSAEDDTITITTTGVTNVRSGPGTDYTIIGRLFPNETVTANGRNDVNNEWFQIEFNDDLGWVASAIVILNDDPTQLSVVEASDSSEIFVGNTDVTATFNVDANIRIGPGTDYLIIAVAQEGAIFDVNGRTVIQTPIVCRGSQLLDVARATVPENVWLRINYAGVNAWVNYSVVAVTGNLCDVESVSVADAEQYTEDLAENLIEEAVGVEVEIDEITNLALIITNDNVSLRETNYSASEVLVVIPYDTSLVAEARNQDSSRIRVTYDEQTGWISTAYITVTQGNINNLAVEQE